MSTETNTNNKELKTERSRSQSQQVPPLRFKEFDGEWSRKRLDEISTIQRGRFSPRPRNNPIYYGGEIPFVQTSDVVNSNGRISTYSQTLNEKGLKVSKKFSKGSLLITIAANIGYAGVLELDMACPDSLIGLTCKAKLHNWFLNYLLRIDQPKMDYLAIAAAQKNINIEFLKSYKFNLPSLPEQQKIAAFLSVVDEKIQQLTRKKELLEQYKKGVMQKLFPSTGSGQSPEIRFKIHNADGELVEPPDWEEKKLGNYLIKHEEKTAENNQYPVLTSSRVGLFFQKDYYAGKEVASEDNTGYNVVPRGYFTYRHMSDDLVFKFNINHLCDKGIVSTLYPVFTTKPGLDDQYLVLKLNNGDEFRKYAILQKQGGSRTYMYFKKLAELNMNLPCLQEQQEIADYISAIDTKIDSVNNQITQTKAFKKGLLQQMFV